MLWGRNIQIKIEKCNITAPSSVASVIEVYSQWKGGKSLKLCLADRIAPPVNDARAL